MNRKIVYVSKSLFAFFIAVAWPAAAFAQVDLGGISPVNLLFSILIGLALGALVYFIAYRIRLANFAKSVKIANTAPEKAYLKYWGKSTKTVTIIIAVLLALCVGAYVYWMLG